MSRMPALRSKTHHGRYRRRRGAVLVLAALLMMGMVALLAFAVDVGYICYEKTRAQIAADAAAHAGACGMMSSPDALAVAKQDAIAYAMNNMPNAGNVLTSSDVIFGVWNAQTRTFTADASTPNAVKVIVRRSASNSNRVPLFFARAIGHAYADVSAEAITMIPDGKKTEFRFLIDDEMIDSDIDDIEELAHDLKIPPDDLISDRNNNGWIDIPPGSILEVPTGQVSDEGMFDRKSYESAFPFKANSTYTTLDFLADGTALRSQLGTQNLQTKSWTNSNAPHKDLKGKKVLDPTLGVDPMKSHTAILNLPDPNTTYVSPVYKSDVSMVERTTSKYGSPAANLLGERRGLVAFKITSARNNPAGGSYLPLVTIKIVDPSTINLQQLGAGGGGTSGVLKPKIVK